MTSHIFAKQAFLAMSDHNRKINFDA